MNPSGRPTKFYVSPRLSSDVWKNLTSLPPLYHHPQGLPRMKGNQLDHHVLVRELEGGPKRPVLGTGLGGESGPWASSFHV